MKLPIVIMEGNNVYYLIFSNIHDVLKTEKKIKSEKIDYELVPVPRQLSSDCGVSIKLKDLNSALNLIDSHLLEACYLFDGREFKKLSL